MPKLTIDNRDIEVTSGTKVLEAAEALGIMIPRFCYHPALGSVGACRVCAVNVLKGQRCSGIQMSCMIDAEEGMVVSTTDAEAVDFRKQVIEWLMLNHPHDCPVCDEGGHCLLQDLTVSGGHGRRRYLGKKRTHRDQYLGPLVQHEMNRCIQCYRCVRYYREYSGFGDLGVMGIGSRVYFGRYQEGTLSSPFTGNLIDICPTGVYTDKPSRYMGRRWDFERGESVCIHCSLGCRTVASVRYREVVRQEALFNPVVNGHFICDRGRYGFAYANAPDRPRSGRVDTGEVSRQEAIEAASTRLNRIHDEAGPSAVVCLGSPRSSLETLAALSQLCRHKGWQGPVCWSERSQAQSVTSAITGLDDNLAVSLKEVEQADLIMVLGADPLNEAPMLAMAMRQASENGASVTVIDPRPVELPMAFTHLPVLQADMAGCLGLMVKAAVEGSVVDTSGSDAMKTLNTLGMPGSRTQEAVSTLAGALSGSRKPVIVCGTGIPSPADVGFAAYCARLLKAAGKSAGLFFILPGANAWGAGLVSDPDLTFEEVLAAIESGSVKALLIVESNLCADYPDSKRVKAALARLDLMVALDYLGLPSTQAADIVVPTTTVFESGGTFINQESRAQWASAVYAGGLSIARTGGGDHPPRTFRTGIQGGQPQAAWRALSRLAQAPDPDVWLSEALSPVCGIPLGERIPSEGIRVIAAGSHDKQPGCKRPAAKRPASDENLGPALITVDWTFGTETLSAAAACLQEMEKPPCLLMHESDADKLGLKTGDRVAIDFEAGTLEVDLAVAGNMAPGAAVLPRHRQLKWQCTGTGSPIIGRGMIRRVGGGAP